MQQIDAYFGCPLVAVGTTSWHKDAQNCMALRWVRPIPILLSINTRSRLLMSNNGTQKIISIDPARARVDMPHENIAIQFKPQCLSGAFMDRSKLI